MSKRSTELSFIIGLFFTIVSLILLIGYFTSELLSSARNMYAGIAFLVFGLFMIFVTKEDKTEN
ncbi:MAG: hypothetical protein QM764_19685 [Chitinophagaceae bacterium]